MLVIVGIKLISSNYPTPTKLILKLRILKILSILRILRIFDGYEETGLN